jgi:hypothetical protein
MQELSIAGRGRALESALAFFGTIFAAAPADTAIVVTTPREGWRPHAVAGNDPLAASRVALGLGTDVFVGVGLQDPAAAAATRKGRGRIEDVVALTATGLDLDLAKTKSPKRYLPDRAIALEFLETLPIRPTVRVWSGAGFQPWWAFREPIMIWGADERAAAQRLVRRFHAYIRQRLNGYDLDATADLARVLRVAGSTNSKYGTPVILEDASGPHVDPAELEELCIAVPDLEATPVAAMAGLPGSLDPAAVPPAARFAALCRSSPLFARVWRREVSPKDRSQSGFDFRLATLAAWAGWEDTDIVSLLIAHRRLGGGPQKLRVDYFTRTIARARVAAAAMPARRVRVVKVTT